MKKFSLNFLAKSSLAASAAMALGACAPTFHCTDGMKGPGCNSVSQVYENKHQDKSLSKVYQDNHPDTGNTPVSATAHPPTGLPQTIHPGDPLRSGERVLRVWMAPWVDKDGDYHDQSYVYLVLNHGHWYVDQARKSIKRRFAPHVLPPASKSTAPDSGHPENAAASTPSGNKPTIPINLTADTPPADLSAPQLNAPILQ